MEESQLKVKASELASWPGYQGLEDIPSHVHFIEYLKEFIPNLAAEIVPLRPYPQEGARFEHYLNDAKAPAAKKRLAELVVA